MIKKYSLVLVAFLCFVLSGFGQATILIEAFRTGSLPTGWTQNDVTFTTAGAGYANFTQTWAVLTSPIIDLSTFTNVTLVFDVAKFGSGTNGPITVQISDDGGASWTAQAYNSPTPFDANYVTSGPSAITATGSTVRIRFTRAGSLSGKRFRDIVLKGDLLTDGVCGINSAGLTALSCDDNGTDTNGSDDFITFDLNPAGSDLGTTYSVSVDSGTINPTTGTYGAVTAFSLQNGSAGGGNVTVTITDGADTSCTLNIPITDPGSCSTGGGSLCNELFISEYVEGSSNNKYIEIYNPTGSIINLAGYELRLYANGAVTPTSTEILTGTISAYGTKVYRNSAATIYLGASTASNVCNFNGDDAVALWNSGNFIDIMGSIGHDPGTQWTAPGGYSTLDKTIVRRASIESGVTINPSTGFPTLDTEWEVYPVDTISNLGSHTSDCQGPTPEIQLVDADSNNQNCGYTINFGNRALATNTDITFTMENIGSAVLAVTSLNISGDYTLVTPPAIPFNIAPSGSQPITVRFIPTANGTRTATLTINNNDVNEGTCTVLLTGVGFTPAPEINVEGNLGSFPDITNGDSTPIGTDNTLFAAQFIGSSQSKSFRINNQGTSNLTISGVIVGGVNPGDFTVSIAPAVTITPSTFSLLEITFSPLVAGVRTAIISIANNDSDENPFTFTVQGTGNCVASSTTISPSSGPVGTVITLIGTNYVPSTTAHISGIAATVTYISSTVIEVTVPNGASTGNLVVVNDIGCSSSNSFTVINNQISGCEGSSNLSDLFISEITDATVGGVSYIEIYNGTGSEVILNEYSLSVFSNGDSTPSGSLALNNVSLANNATYVVVIGVAGSPSSSNTCSITGGNGQLANQTSGIGGINKKDNEHDAIRLLKSGGTIVVDEFGVYQDSDWMDITIVTGDRGFNFRRLNTASTLPNPTFDINEWNVIDWIGSGADSCDTNDYSDIGVYDFSTGTPPTLSILEAPSSDCDLTSILTVTGAEGFNGGNPIAYQWYYNAPGTATWIEILSTNGNYSGQQSDTLVILNTLNLDNFQYYCQVRENTATCYTASNAIRLQVDKAIWNGASWTPAPPTINSIAVIDGNYDTGNGANGQTSFEACQLIVNSGSTLTISDVDNDSATNTYIKVQNNILNSGEIYVDAKAALVQVDDDGTFTLNEANAKNTLSKFTHPLQYWYDYTYWSSPLENAQIEIALFQSKANRRFYYDASNFNDILAEIGNTGTFNVGSDDIDDEGDDWINQQIGSMTPGVGYAGTHNNSVPFISGTSYQYIFEGTLANGGAFNTGNINVPIYIDPSVSYNNWNLIGNPYPSAISAQKFFEDTQTFLEGIIYLWSQSTNADANASGNQNQNFSQDDYAMINYVGGLAVGDDATSGSNIPNGYVPSGQGFFVIGNKSAVPTTGYINPVVFNNAMRDTGNNTQFFRTIESTPYNKLWLNLTSDNGIFSQVLIGYVDGATDDYDGMHLDALRNLSTGTRSILYMTIPNMDKKYAIQGKNPSSLSIDEVIRLGFYTSIDIPTAYKLSVDQFEGTFFSDHTVFIKDNLLNLTHNLSSSDYTFTSETGTFDTRFEIVFTNATLSVIDNEIPASGLSIIELTSGQVKFSVGNSLDIKAVEIIDMLGRTLYQLQGNAPTEIYDLSNLSQVAYIAKVTLSNGQVITKRAVKRL